MCLTNQFKCLVIVLWVKCLLNKLKVLILGLQNQSKILGLDVYVSVPGLCGRDRRVLRACQSNSLLKFRLSKKPCQKIRQCMMRKSSVADLIRTCTPTSRHSVSPPPHTHTLRERENLINSLHIKLFNALLIACL